MSKKLFESARLSILSIALNPATADAVADSDAYAWSKRVHPFGRDSEIAGEFDDFFHVNASMMNNVARKLGELYDEGITNNREFDYSFYNMESEFIEGGGAWDRMLLVHAVRYFAIKDSDDRWLFEHLVRNEYAPMEAMSVVREFSRADITLL